jgi:ATP-dependent Zn protease
MYCFIDEIDAVGRERGAGIGGGMTNENKLKPIIN